MKRRLLFLIVAAVSTSVASVKVSVLGAESFGAKRSVSRQWDMCADLIWKVVGNVDGKTRRQVVRAVAEFRRVSRIDFRFAGVAADEEFASPPPNTLVIGVDQTLAGSRVAGLTTLWYADGASDPRVVSGARIAINPRVMSRASTGFPALLPVLLHELGHVAGLDHVNDPADLMYPSIVDVRAYRPRDVALLRRGATGVCSAGAGAASQ